MWRVKWETWWCVIILWSAETNGLLTRSHHHIITCGSRETRDTATREIIEASICCVLYRWEPPPTYDVTSADTTTATTCSTPVHYWPLSAPLRALICFISLVSKHSHLQLIESLKHSSLSTILRLELWHKINQRDYRRLADASSSSGSVCHCRTPH